jgi:hypothetical protein
MALVSFSKYDGLGNDFIVVEASDEHGLWPEPAAVARSLWMHRGVVTPSTPMPELTPASSRTSTARG